MQQISKNKRETIVLLAKHFLRINNLKYVFLSFNFFTDCTLSHFVDYVYNRYAKSRFGQYATEVYFGTRATVCQACASSPNDNVFDINYRDCNKIYYLPSPAYQFKVLGSSNKFGFTELLYAYIMSTDIKY